MDRLDRSLSLALSHYFPLAGRLATMRHHDAAISVYIECNNAGAELVHAIAPSVTAADIKNSVFVPKFVHDFFQLNGVLNYGHENEIPVLVVQVTELIDGIFIGITMNHAVVDGTSFWQFVNTWSEISRTGSDNFISSHPPVFHRWFPDNLHPPIGFPFVSSEEHCSRLISHPPLQPPLVERVFHFSQGSIERLKAKANAEQPLKTHKISSLQSVVAHVWLAATRARGLGCNEETRCVMLIGNRGRLVPPLPENYFGGAVGPGIVVAKVGELLEEGIGGVAMQLNRAVAAHDDVLIRNSYESWVKNPMWFTPEKPLSNAVAVGCSARFSVYGNDFGWGRPVGVRGGSGNKFDGTVNVYEGEVEGSMDFESCFSAETLKAMGDDPEFMGAVDFPIK
ncbi:hypothetical protein Sjap_017323 [Stephania japonica]|uniref:HXXXD-type acyl-transferase family protein n=1 Tax=Stephania japonica TaxID=461633 RepID=A0AAP0I616_9MAGN